MKKMTLLILAVSFSTVTMAQILVTGIVSNDSISLESASVIIKNSSKGIATNSKGGFEIEVRKGDTLSISYLGYKTKELIVNEKKHLQVKLDEENILNEVVILAFDSHRNCSGMFCRVSIIHEEHWGYNKPIALFPNPSSNGIFELMLYKNYDEVEISIANISGHIIQHSTHQKFGEKLLVDLSQFSRGIYILKIIADGKLLTSLKAIRS